MTVKIVKIDPEDENEVNELNNIAVYSFHPSPSDEDLKNRNERSKFRKNSEQFLLYEDKEAVASSTIHPLKQNLRGNVVKVGGVATVGTLPHARRKGYVRKLMQKMFQAMKDQGQFLSILHPFSESYYEKFGYVTLPDRIQVSFSPDNCKSVLQFDLPGSTKLSLLKDRMDQFLEFVEKSQLENLGMIQFHKERYQDKAASELWILEIYDQEEQCIGLLTYTIEGYLKSLEVHFMSYLKNTNAKYYILEFFAKHLGQVKDIKVPIRKSDEIERWLPNLELNYESHDGAMVRVIDVEKISELLENHRVEPDISIDLRVIDPLCEWNHDVFRFESIDENLKVTRLGEDHDYQIQLDIKGLSAMIYGYYNLEEMRFRGMISGDFQHFEQLSDLLSYEPHEVVEYF